MKPRRAAIAVLGAMAAACGINGSAPTVQPAPAVLSDLTVQGQDGVVRVSWISFPGASPDAIASYDVLRWIEVPGQRTFFTEMAHYQPGPRGKHRENFIDNTLGSRAVVHYRVRARFAKDVPAQDLHYSGPDETIVWAAPPEAPQAVSAVPLHLSARLSWEPVQGVSGYRIYRVDSSGKVEFDPVTYGTINGASSVASDGTIAFGPDGRATFTVVGLADGQEDRFVVRSVVIDTRARPALIVPTPVPRMPSANEVAAAAAQGISIPPTGTGAAVQKGTASLLGEGPLPGIESKSSAVVKITPGLTLPPAPPHLLRAVSVADGIALTWRLSQSEEVAGYFVERRAVENGKPVEIWQRLNASPIVAGTGIQRADKPPGLGGYIDHDAKKGLTYQYQVRAVDASGTEGSPTEPAQATFVP